MGEILNLANAILILGAIYFGYTYGFNEGHYFLIAWGLILWAYYGFQDQRKQIYEAKIRLLHSKAAYYDRQHQRAEP